MLTLLRFINSNWLPISVATLIGITTLSIVPLAELPSVPGIDKTHHFVAYAVLMFPVALRKPKYWLWVALFFVGWSGAIELIQPYVNRYGEWSDLLANVVGILCGIGIARLLNRWVLGQMTTA